jgi:hypothetical protein
MGRLATGIRHFGYLYHRVLVKAARYGQNIWDTDSSGFEVKVLSETPGPQRTRAWNPVWGTGRGIALKFRPCTRGLEVL